MVSGVSTAAMCWRSRPRMGMIRGGMGGLRGAALWGCHHPPSCPESLSCSRGDKVFSIQELHPNFVAFDFEYFVTIYRLREADDFTVSATASDAGTLFG